MNAVKLTENLNECPADHSLFEFNIFDRAKSINWLAADS